MRPTDLTQLEDIGLTLYERKALLALMVCGVADAATLCREGEVPTSKIYLAMEKLAGLGLVQVQPTRPKMFAALPSEVVVARIVEIVRERSEHFASQASDLHALFTGLRSRARRRGAHPATPRAACGGSQAYLVVPGSRRSDGDRHCGQEWLPHSPA